MGSGLKVTVFAKNAAPITTDKKSAQILDAIRKKTSITNDELAKFVGNITIDGIRYHINKMKKANLIVRRNGKKEGYWEILD
jgi:ATP-dependent DNA helicase RecG